MIHAREDYGRIQDPSGLIPADMPVFLLLGKDKHAARTVRFWADQVESDGGDAAIVAMARAHADLMDTIPFHKQPDLPTRQDIFQAAGRRLRSSEQNVIQAMTDAAHSADWLRSVTDQARITELVVRSIYRLMDEVRSRGEFLSILAADAEMLDATLRLEWALMRLE